jgi:predicted Zn-dependent protease
MRVGTDPYITSVGERLHAQTPLANRPFHFYVVDDPSVNAFAIPGGHIYVNRGLIAQADRANMLAGVMAHEMSHVVARHVIKQAEQTQVIGAIGSILLGQNPNGLAVLVANVAAGGAMARFSRADEKQADDMGLDLMTRAGYDPHGMLDMFQKLLALDQGGNSSVARFFADHPGTTDRIRDISARIAKMGRTGGIVDDPAYQQARRRLGV